MPTGRPFALSPWLRSYGLYAGGMIGVGVFGLPAALVRAGLVPFLFALVVVAVLAYSLQRSFLTVVLAVRERHRIPGYARLLLPPAAARLTAVVNVAGLTGALVAYLLAGPTYLRLLLQPLVPFGSGTAVALYVLPAAFLLLRGLRALPAVELLILALFLAVLLVLPLPAAETFTFENLSLVGEASDFLLPYGILLFAFWGISLIPEAAELALRKAARARSVTGMTILTAMLSYLLFSVLVAGITGYRTTDEALTGLTRTLGDGVVVLTLFFGVLTTFSSYLALALTLQRTLELDFRLRKLPVWFLTIFGPLALVASGTVHLLPVLAVTGAVFLGIEGIAILALRARLRDGQRLLPPLTFAALLLAFGVILELRRAIF